MGWTKRKTAAEPATELSDFSDQAMENMMRNFLSARLTTIIDEDGENVNIERKFLYNRDENPLEEQTTTFILGDISKEMVNF